MTTFGKSGGVSNPNPRESDEHFMRLAIGLAERGRGKTAPNPVVGAVIVRKGRVIGRGWHAAAGGDHAEIAALKSLRRPSEARGADLFVTLEPCSTQGRTPPCTDAILRAGIRRVICGATDPNPRHAGRAWKILQSAGVDARGGVLSGECAALNEAWNFWIATGRPFVTAKAGISLDGRLTPPRGARWITSPEARADAMRLRASSDAILVGGGTVRADDPRLTLRGFPGMPPLRVVWTRSGNLPARARIFTDKYRGRTRVFQGLSLRSVLETLGSEGIQSVLIEGGSRVHGEAFRRGLVQRVVFYVAPTILGGGLPVVGDIAAPSRQCRIRDWEVVPIGPDLRISGIVENSKKKRD